MKKILILIVLALMHPMFALNAALMDRVHNTDSHCPEDNRVSYEEVFFAIKFSDLNSVSNVEQGILDQLIVNACEEIKSKKKNASTDEQIYGAKKILKEIDRILNKKDAIEFEDWKFLDKLLEAALGYIYSLLDDFCAASLPGDPRCRSEVEYVIEPNLLSEIMANFLKGDQGKNIAGKIFSLAAKICFAKEKAAYGMYTSQIVQDSINLLCEKNGPISQYTHRLQDLTRSIHNHIEEELKQIEVPLTLDNATPRVMEKLIKSTRETYKDSTTSDEKIRKVLISLIQHGKIDDKAPPSNIKNVPDEILERIYKWISEECEKRGESIFNKNDRSALKIFEKLDKVTQKLTSDMPITIKVNDVTKNDKADANPKNTHTTKKTDGSITVSNGAVSMTYKYKKKRR